MPVGVAVDAACGTGRHTAYLASLGHEVIGVDDSPEMLARARDKVARRHVPRGRPARHPARGRLRRPRRLCDRAQSRAQLEPVLGELVRVLRPGGHLVVSDSRGLIVIGDIGLPLVRVGPDGEYGYMPVYSRLASDYLAAALPLGLQVRRCEERRRPSPLYGEDGTDLHQGARPPDHVPGEPPNIWPLNALAPAATNAAWHGNPVAIVWHFQLPAA